MKAELFEDLMSSISEGGAILKGNKKPSREFSFNEIDVSKIRQKHKLSQGMFATLLGISPKTLQNWEQKRRKPEGPARVLLQIADLYPKVLVDFLKIRSKKHSGIRAAH